MANPIFKVLGTINSILEKVSIALMLFLLFLTFANVVGRYAFSKSIYFADELARYVFVWITYLGVAKITREKRHVAVTLLNERLAGSVPGFVLETFVFLCGTAFAAVVFIGGIQLSTTMMFLKSAALGIPMGLMYLALPVGMGLTLIYQVINYAEDLSEFRSSREAKGGGA